MKISSQISLIKMAGIAGGLCLLIYGLTTAYAIKMAAAILGDMVLVVVFQSALYFMLAAGVFALTNLCCKLLARAFKDEIEAENAEVESNRRYGRNASRY